MKSFFLKSLLIPKVCNNFAVLYSKTVLFGPQSDGLARTFQSGFFIARQQPIKAAIPIQFLRSCGSKSLGIATGRQPFFILPIV